MVPPLSRAAAAGLVLSALTSIDNAASQDGRSTDSAVPRPAAEAPTEPSVRISFVDSSGSAVKVAAQGMEAVDATGIRHRPRSNGGVIEFSELPPGTYWLSLWAARWKRQMKTVSIEGTVPLELEIALEPDPGPGQGATGYLYGEGEGEVNSIAKSGPDSRAAHLSFELVDEKGAALPWGTIVLYSRDSWLHEDSLAGPFEIDLFVPMPVRLAISADGRSPLALELDTSKGDSFDLGALHVPKAFPVAVRAVVPEEVWLKHLGVEYGPIESFRSGGHHWNKPLSESEEAVVDLGPGQFVVLGRASGAGREFWSSPLRVFDPSKDGQVQLELSKTMPVVIDPFPWSDAVKRVVIDDQGLIVRTDHDYVDIPHRIELVPGDYVIRYPETDLPERSVRLSPDGHVTWLR